MHFKGQKVLGYSTHATLQSASLQEYETLEQFREAHPRKKHVYIVCFDQWCGMFFRFKVPISELTDSILSDFES